MSRFLMPLTKRDHSTAVRLNFLFNEGNAYVMDNHRAALWCWLRHMEPGKSYGLLHVDRHYDAVIPTRDLDKLRSLDLSGLDLDEYLQASSDEEFLTSVPLIRWDNYIGVLMALMPDTIHDWAFATHGQGARPDTVEIFEMQPWQLPMLDLTQGGPWLVNLDADYFFYKGPDRTMRPMFSPDYMDGMLAPVRAAMDAGEVAALTISLSPECAGGWEGSEAMAGEITRRLGLDFSLPD